MQVKEAVSAAKSFVADLFSDEQVRAIGLEEVEFDESAGVWNVTVGFSRGEKHQGGMASLLGDMKRDYKIVRIADIDQKVLSVKNREVG